MVAYGSGQQIFLKNFLGAYGNHRVPKSFFDVTVGGFLSVEPCPTSSR